MKRLIFLLLFLLAFATIITAKDDTFADYKIVINSNQTVSIECKPSPGFDYCQKVAVFIKEKPEIIYSKLISIEGLSYYFPDWEFKSNGELKVGSIYYAKMKSNKNWSSYKVIHLENNHRISGEQVEGLFKNWRYDHKLISVEGGTVSEEVLEYSFPWGFIGKLLNCVYAKNKISRVMFYAHNSLKNTFE